MYIIKKRIYMCMWSYLDKYIRLATWPPKQKLLASPLSAWKIRGVVSVIGRDSFFYFIHFEILEDLNHFCAEVPWSVDGACLILEKWRPNLVLSQL